VLGTAPDVVADAVENQCEQERLGRQLNKLSGREKWVLEMRFGMPGGAKKTQRDIAKLLGISRSYVSRIEKHGLQTASKSLYSETPINLFPFFFGKNGNPQTQNDFSFLLKSISL
jgi:RNA polymerase sporulation-specific sigma factor